MRRPKKDNNVIRKLVAANDELIRLTESVIMSADNTGCTDDLTVVSAESLRLLEDFIVNHCEES